MPPAGIPAHAPPTGIALASTAPSGIPPSGIPPSGTPPSGIPPAGNPSGIFRPVTRVAQVPPAGVVYVTGWPLHDIVITNIVWCMAYTGGAAGGRILRNGRAIVLQSGRLCKGGGATKG